MIDVSAFEETTSRASTVPKAVPTREAAGAWPALRRLPRLSWSARLDLVLLVVAVATGSALRLTGLDAVGLNSDEAVYASQAGSLAGNAHFTDLFPIVRAHPLLFQMLISPLYAHGAPDAPGRYVAAAFGVGTIALVFLCGRMMFAAPAGGIAALLLALCPYAVTIDRQILLDGPMTFFATGALLCLAMAARTGRGPWLLAAGAAIGLAALTKESAAILLGAMFAFVALNRRLWRPIGYPIGGLLLGVGLVGAYPLLTAIAGGSRGGTSYLVWQLTREPNHSADFYPITVGAAIGWVVIAVGIVGLAVFRRWSWREVLLVVWAAVPLLFFELWPTKGFSYLLPIAPVFMLLAARSIAMTARAGARRPDRHEMAAVVLPALAVLVALGAAASVALPAVQTVAAPANSGLAGAGGLDGGRAAGRWTASHTPSDAMFMTIGPSLANLIQFYGGRPADGLSVSPNPLHRNPSYRSIDNADAALRTGAYTYIVWDAYSAARSPFFAARAEQLIQRFHAVPVATERGVLGGVPDQKLVVIYRVGAPKKPAVAVGFDPLALPSVAPPAVRRAPAQPHVPVLYAGYGAAILIASATIGTAVVLSRRRGRERS